MINLKDGSTSVTTCDHIRPLIILHRLNIIRPGLNPNDLSATNPLNEYTLLTPLRVMIYTSPRRERENRRENVLSASAPKNQTLILHDGRR